MTSFCPTCSTMLETGDPRCATCGTLPPDGGFPRDERVGQVVAFGQFRVVRRLGAGGFGVVYEVETVVGKLRRAMKVLARRWAEDDDVQQRFVNEALVLEQVNHPNVARCYAAGRLETNDLYLLLELVDGVELASIVREGPLDPMRAVHLAKQIATGLEAAHAAGVLHRDLKPENILVCDAGGPREQVKVVDFGIAKLLDAGATSTQSVVGTPEFMSPEQFLPGSRLDLRIDLWQLGAVLFSMLTGKAPYRADSGGIAWIMAEQHRHAELGPAPSEILPEMRAQRALDLLTSRLLASDPARRPSSAAEVCEELARIEHALSPEAARGGSEALLGALCATPSESSWVALHGYLASQADRRDGLVAVATRMLEGWPEHLRRAPLSVWEASKRGGAHPLWPLTRTLDLSARGIGDDELERLASNPALATITRLDLSRNEIGNAGVEALARSPHLGALEHLDLSHNRIHSGGLEVLAREGAMRGLRSLRMAHNGIGTRGAQALAGSRLRLFELDLSGNDLGPGGATALAEADSLAGLGCLGLAGNRIGPDGVAALAVSRHLTRLRELDLSHDAIGPSGAAALALGANVRSLRSLRLARNGLGREGLQLLLASTSFDDLRELDLSGNGLGAAGAMLLAGSPFVRRLVRLDLSDGALGDAGAAALLGSSHLGGLRSLGLAQNGLTASGAALLASAPPQLDELDLSHNPLANAGAEAVADALVRLRITRLRVCGCTLSAEGVEHLLRSGRLAALDVAGNAIGREGAAVIARVVGADMLESLDLSRCELGPESVGVLLGATTPRAWRRLDLSSNALGDLGATRLVAGGPRLPRLEALGLSDDDIGPDGAEALAASSLASHLRELRLAHNRLGDAGAEILARGPAFHALRVLDLQGNGITLAGAAALWNASSLAMVERIELSSNVLTSIVDVHSLAHDKAERMEQTFGIIASNGADLAERFYDELFARYPRIKPLFANVNMTRQRQHLLSALALVIEHLREPDTAEAELLELGRRHLGYGVVPTHYHAVVSTLLDTIRDVLAEDWNEEVESAWHDGLDAVANVMMRAQREPSTKSEDPHGTTMRRGPV